MNMKSKNHFISESKLITENELKNLLKSVRPHMELAIKEMKNLHLVTDYYLFYLGSLTGCRVSEVISIQLGDVGPNTLQVIGKGRKARIIPLGKKGRAAIDELIRLKKEVFNCPTKPTEYLFLNRNRKPLTRHAVAARFRYWAPKAGITRQINYHSFRHRFCCYLLDNGFHIGEVSKIMGHSSIQITSAYLHFTRNTLDRVESVL